MIHPALLFRPTAVTNVLSVDVEEAFHASAFELEAPPCRWPSLPSRGGDNLRRLLALFESVQVKATFFTLGWMARREPALIRQLASLGHEVACHGDQHRRIPALGPRRFREDLRAARDCLQDLLGAPVTGFRAPTWSITVDTLWALEILAEEGFRYDSSIFPVHHDRYGIPWAPRFPFQLRLPQGQLLQELPPTTFRLGRWNLPAAGGGYLRLYPEGVTRGIITWLNRVERRAAVVYVHPWEIDVSQPRLTTRRLGWWRHAVNIPRTFGRLERLLQGFAFAPAREVLAQQQHWVTMTVADLTGRRSHA